MPSASAFVPNLSQDQITTSQQGLNDEDKSLHTHLVTKHHPHLNQDITGFTANDLPYSYSSEAHFEPGIAKANVAATSARPHGTTEGGWNVKHSHETVSRAIPNNQSTLNTRS